MERFLWNRYAGLRQKRSIQESIFLKPRNSGRSSAIHSAEISCDVNGAIWGRCDA